MSADAGISLQVDMLNLELVRGLIALLSEALMALPPRHPVRIRTVELLERIHAERSVELEQLARLREAATNPPPLENLLAANHRRARIRAERSHPHDSTEGEQQ